MQLKDLYKRIKESLEMASIDEADNEAYIILRELADCSRTTLLSYPDKEIDEQIIANIEAVVSKRQKREPLQYILGKWDFMGLEFEVSEGVLIPRSDTEVLVETVLKDVHDGMRILDLCTGTGCIAISLLKYSNDCIATAVDISDTAVELAKRNAESILGNDCKLEINLADLYDGASGQYDIIVSNPPYIDTDVIETLEPEVKDYEPKLALDGGKDGLDIVRRIVEGASEKLIGGGSIYLEIGYDQGPRTCKLFEDAGFINVECIKDYAGLDRVVRASKSAL